MDVQEFFSAIPKLEYTQLEEHTPPRLFHNKGTCWEQALYVYSLALHYFPKRDVSYIFTSGLYDLRKTEGMCSYTTHATVGIRYNRKFYWVETSWLHAYGLHEMDYTRKYNYRSFDDICKDIHRIHRNQSGEYTPLVSNPNVDVDLFLKADTTFKDYTFLDSCLPPEYSYKLANDLVTKLSFEDRKLLLPKHSEKYVNSPYLLHRSIIDNLGILESPKDKYTALAFCDVSECSASHQVLITSIVTDPSFRNSGLGTLALEHAIEWCRFAKYKSILYGALPENEASIHLAQKLGFKINDKESTDTDVVLELKL